MRTAVLDSLAKASRESTMLIQPSQGTPPSVGPEPPRAVGTQSVCAPQDPSLVLEIAPVLQFAGSFLLIALPEVQRKPVSMADAISFLGVTGGRTGHSESLLEDAPGKMGGQDPTHPPPTMPWEASRH